MGINDLCPILNVRFERIFVDIGTSLNKNRIYVKLLSTENIVAFAEKCAWRK